MIELYFWPTPNCWKISIALEELNVPYILKPVNITTGAQHEAAFREISPGGKVPAIVHNLNGQRISVFESGAILQYLAETFGGLLPDNQAEKRAAHQWLFWQVANLGPISGQANHFLYYAPNTIPYAQTRYIGEYRRLLTVLEKQLSSTPYIAGNQYSIADISIWPWILPYKRIIGSLDDFPNLSKWRDMIKSRPAVQKGVSAGKKMADASVDENKARSALFG